MLEEEELLVVEGEVTGTTSSSFCSLSPSVETDTNEETTSPSRKHFSVNEERSWWEVLQVNPRTWKGRLTTGLLEEQRSQKGLEALREPRRSQSWAAW